MKTVDVTPTYIPQIRLFQTWLDETRGRKFPSYADLWEWSVNDLDGFWSSVWDYFDLQSPTGYASVLESNVMPGANPGARFNYASQVFRHVEAADSADFPAIIAADEEGTKTVLSWTELRRQAASFALYLQSIGLQPGDRVVAYMPNVPETIVSFLAVVSVGCVWSVCSPDTGVNAVIDRFSQIEPKVLIACDGIRYGGRTFDKTGAVSELLAKLPSLQHVIVHRTGLADAHSPQGAEFSDVIARSDGVTAAFEPIPLPFDHPLWIVYSSGTTGLPKPIVHGHGGTVIVGLTLNVLHNDVGCSYHPNSWGEKFHWYSTTAWVMWNAQVSGLLNGTTCCIYDGNPSGSRDNPDWGALWRFSAETGVTFFGAGAAFYASCAKAAADLTQYGDLGRIRALGATGSPLSVEAQEWGTTQFQRLAFLRRRTGETRSTDFQSNIWWCNISGGTDFAGGFIGGNRELPMIQGEMQCRLLGCAVESWSEDGATQIDEVGELVCVQPIPSMPLYLWGDANNERYLSSYFDSFPAGLGRRGGLGPVWRHGDWLKVTAKGSCIIYGRSDATINRLRMGTSELYRAVEALPEVLDSLVVDLEYLGRESYMPLFVSLRDDLSLDSSLKKRIADAIRNSLSPRFTPNDIFHVPDIPRTLSGKKQELPIKKLLLGHDLDKVLNKGTMANPASLDWFIDFAKRRSAA